MSVKVRHLTEAHRKNISNALLGEKNYMYGKHRTDATKRKISLTLTGRKKKPFTEAHKKKISEANKGKHLSEKTRKKMSAVHKGVKKKPFTEFHKKNLSLSHKGQIPWNTDWDFYYKNGCFRSQYPYGPEWTSKLKKQIAERDDYTCQLCNEILPDKGDTHHIDYDKDNNSEYNLIFLCGHCHSKTNTNRAFWTQYFKDLQDSRGFGEGQYNSQTSIDNWIST